MNRSMVKGLACLLVVFAVIAAPSAHAREGAAVGVFFDLPGSLSDGGVLPMTRLVLGDGFAVAHLDILFGLPTAAIPAPGLRSLPYLAVNFPLTFGNSAVLTPYAAVAPILFTAGALATPPLADWTFKFGSSFTFGGFGLFAETGFYMPVAALPSFAVGFMVDFASINALFCDACAAESFY